MLTIAVLCCDANVYASVCLCACTGINSLCTRKSARESHLLGDSTVPACVHVCVCMFFSCGTRLCVCAFSLYNRNDRVSYVRTCNVRMLANDYFQCSKIKFTRNLCPTRTDVVHQCRPDCLLSLACFRFESQVPQWHSRRIFQSRNSLARTANVIAMDTIGSGGTTSAGTATAQQFCLRWHNHQVSEERAQR